MCEWDGVIFLSGSIFSDGASDQRLYASFRAMMGKARGRNLYGPEV